MMRSFLAALFLACLTMSCTGLSTARQEQPGRPHHPSPSTGDYYTESGVASWYGEAFHQKPTATGEVYDMYALTAAHRTLPLGTWVVVTDLESRRSVRVRINDRGPFVKDRIIDLSYGAASELGILEKGTTRVELRCSYSEETLRDQLGYWVQLGAYEDGALAGDLAVRLREEHPNVRILSSETYHHVRIGPFPSEPEANRVKELFLEKGERAFVVRDLLSLSPQSEEGSTTWQEEVGSTRLP
jgi:rare lipoprotein A